MDELLDMLGLTKLQDHFPNELSGGQQQRTAIGRAVIKNPTLLLCDEPTGALDSKTSKDILSLIEKINEHYHATIMMVTHNEAIANMADHVITILDGEILSDVKNENRMKAEDIIW